MTNTEIGEVKEKETREKNKMREKIRKRKKERY
jgi:hypothetical protein